MLSVSTSTNHHFICVHVKRVTWVTVKNVSKPTNVNLEYTSVTSWPIAEIHPVPTSVNAILVTKETVLNAQISTNVQKN